jgi:hypothetical protein
VLQLDHFVDHLQLADNVPTIDDAQYGRPLPTGHRSINDDTVTMSRPHLQ